MTGLWRSRYCSAVYSVASSTHRIAFTTTSAAHLNTIICSGRGDLQRMSLVCMTLTSRWERPFGSGLHSDAPSSRFTTAGDRGHMMSTESETHRQSLMSPSVGFLVILGFPDSNSPLASLRASFSISAYRELPWPFRGMLPGI